MSGKTSAVFETSEVRFIQSGAAIPGGVPRRGIPS